MTTPGGEREQKCLPHHGRREAYRSDHGWRSDDATPFREYQRENDRYDQNGSESCCGRDGSDDACHGSESENDDDPANEKRSCDDEKIRRSEEENPEECEGIHADQKE